MLINILNEYLCWHLASCTSYTMCLSLSLSPYLFHTVSSHRKRPILALPPQHLSQGMPTSSSHPAMANYDQMSASEIIPGLTLFLLPIAAVQSINGSSTAPLGFTESNCTEERRPSSWNETKPTSDLRDLRSHLCIFLSLLRTSFRRAVPSKYKHPGIFKAS